MADYHTGLVCSVIANCAPFVKHVKTYQPKDFMARKKGKPLSPEEFLEKMKHAHAALTGEKV
jgi:hypothetical protein